MDQKIDFWKIRDKLRETLGRPNELHQFSPLSFCDSALEILIATILTQATSDKNALTAWRNFKANFPCPEKALAVSDESLEKVIQQGGLAKQKAQVIRDVLTSVYRELGEYSLDSIQEDSEKAWQFLNSLKGVGPKTAACTMLFGLKMASFPVDTHIYRIAQRMGLVDKASLAEMQIILEKKIPKEIQADLHILLLNLGRKFCRPKQPKCSVCPIGTECVRKGV